MTDQKPVNIKVFTDVITAINHMQGCSGWVYVMDAQKEGKFYYFNNGIAEVMLTLASVFHMVNCTIGAAINQGFIFTRYCDLGDFVNNKPKESTFIELTNSHEEGTNHFFYNQVDDVLVPLKPYKT